MRKLASIQKILNVRPIEGADKIEVAEVLGWEVVVGKDEFKVGDLAIYFEIDSFLNAEDERYASFQPRFTNWGTKRGMKLKTIKLRGQISQGLLMPIDRFIEVRGMIEGADVTDALKIEKWEPIEETRGNGGGGSGGGKPFPHFIRKTDQERVQNYLRELPKHLDETFEVTIKLDGSSMTVYALNKTSPYYEDALKMQTKKMTKMQQFLQKFKKFFGIYKDPETVYAVCSRNLQLKEQDGSNFWNYVEHNGVINAVKRVNRNLAFQGELIAPSIQLNYEKVNEAQYHIYDVFDIDKQQYLLPEEARHYTNKAGLKYVPVIDEAFDLKTLESTDMKVLTQKILDKAEGAGMNPGVKREGIVFKSNQNKDFSFKAISTSYLLKKSKSE